MAPKSKAVKAEKSAKVEEKASPVRTTRKSSPAKVSNRKASPSPSPAKKGKFWEWMKCFL